MTVYVSYLEVTVYVSYLEVTVYVSYNISAFIDLKMDFNLEDIINTKEIAFELIILFKTGEKFYVSKV